MPMYVSMTFSIGNGFLERRHLVLIKGSLVSKCVTGVIMGQLTLSPTGEYLLVCCMALQCISTIKVLHRKMKQAAIALI